MQHAIRSDGRTVAQTIIDELGQRNGSTRTVRIVRRRGRRDDLTRREDRFVDLNGPFLVPGIGAQGGTVEDVKRIFDSDHERGAPQRLAGSPRWHVLDIGALRAAVEPSGRGLHVPELTQNKPVSSFHLAVF